MINKLVEHYKSRSSILECNIDKKVGSVFLLSLLMAWTGYTVNLLWEELYWMMKKNFCSNTK